MGRTRISAAVAAVVAAAALALPAAACTGGQSSTGSGSSTNSQELAFSRCMRSHGVPSFPDPTAGRIPKETPLQLGVSSSQLQSAESACISLLPSGSSGPSPAELQQSWSDLTNFARCMRSHGVPNWPDPTRYPTHPERPTFDLQPVGIDPNSPQISTEIHECQPLLHGNNPQHLGDGGS